MPGPLSHIRVLDLSRVLAGPWAGQNLADLGAEVIKIERPWPGRRLARLRSTLGQGSRRQGHRRLRLFHVGKPGQEIGHPEYLQPEGQALARELAKRCDVLIENYKYGDLKRYGLGYDELRELNPGLVYCSVTGFGHTGPFRQRPGYDFMIQGMGGMMSVTGEPDGAPGGGRSAGACRSPTSSPACTPPSPSARRSHRERSGRGQHLDLALLDSQIALLAYQNTNYFATGVPPARIGNLHPNIVPYQPFRASDGEVILACGNDNLYSKFCEAAGCRELARDPRFATNGKRVRTASSSRGCWARSSSAARASGWSSSRPPGAQWTDQRRSAGVRRAPGQGPRRAHRARSCRRGRLPLVASPMRFSETPVEYRLAPPVLGEHTVEVLRGLLGKSEAEIARLRAARVI